MPFRAIIFTVMTLTVVGGLILLFAAAGDPPAPDISEQALDRARARHQRSKSRVEPAPSRSAPTGDMPRWKSADKSESKNDSAPSRKVDTSMLPRPKKSTDSARPSLRVPARHPGSESEDADLQSRMRDINRMFDRRDYETALAEAKEVLKEKPGNVRMLRVVVSSACMMGNEPEARSHYDQLPPRHQRQMQRRCSRYGVSFED